MGDGGGGGALGSDGGGTRGWPPPTPRHLVGSLAAYLCAAAVCASAFSAVAYRIASAHDGAAADAGAAPVPSPPPPPPPPAGLAVAFAFAEVTKLASWGWLVVVSAVLAQRRRGAGRGPLSRAPPIARHVAVVAAAVGAYAAMQLAQVGLGNTYCPPRHQTHIEPSFLASNGIP